MNYQDTLLKKYHETRTNFLDPSDEIKLEWFYFYFEKIYQKYFISIPKNAPILELGCNKGHLLRVLHTRGYKNLFGVDLSQGDLECAKKIIPEATLIEEDIFNYLMAHENKFQVIILKALIEHIKKDKVMLLLDSINKSLAPGGFVLIDVQNSDWLFGLHDRYVDFTHEVGFTQESLRQLMVLYFDEVSVTPTQSPFWKMGRKDKIKHYFAKKIVFSLLKWADPESPSVIERLLIASGKKRH